MAQFDVYRNNGLQKASILFVAFVQSVLFDDQLHRSVAYACEVIQGHGHNLGTAFC